MDLIQRMIKQTIVLSSKQVVVTTTENRESFIMMKPYKVVAEIVDDNGDFNIAEVKSFYEEEDAIKHHEKLAKKYEGEVE